MEIDRIEGSAISAIAKQVFGSRTSVLSARQICPDSDGVLSRVGGCNWNLSYVVELKDEAQKFLFRFNRRRYDRGDETILREQENYKLIASHTDVPVPRIHHVDVSRSLVPTGYMVMDHMGGDVYTFLTHPENPQTSSEEKDDILRQAGHSVAQIHNITRTASDPAVGARKVLSAIDALERVVGNARCRVTKGHLDLCRQVVSQDAVLKLEVESLCLVDAELNFEKTDDSWSVSFICDLEYQDFGDPYLDLAKAASAPNPLWALKEPLVIKRADRLTKQPFFRGYEQLRSVDYERLSGIATYSHLCTMASIAREAYRADEGPGIEGREPPIYFELLQVIGQRSRGNV